MSAYLKMPLAVPVLGLALLGGCATEHGDLREELKTMTANLRGNIKPLPVVRPYTAFPYEVAKEPDPFSINKLQMLAKTSKSGLQPDLAREKESLELYPLDAMKMVGTLSGAKKMYGLVKVDTVLFRVSAGTRIGQNYGRVASVNSSEIKIKEVVQDGAGDWTETEATLTLQENEEIK